MNIRTLIVSTVLVIFGSLFALTSQSFGAEDVTPIFNPYDNVAGQGDESDFVRVRKTGTQNAFSNNVNDACVDGQEVSVQVYIHNGASQDYNGTNFDGTAVARDTKLALTKSSNNVNGKLSASNAPSLMDSANITCNGQPVEFEYVLGSALQTNSQGNVPISNNVFSSNGTLIGFEGANGTLPACWEYVTIVYAKVVIKKPAEPVVKKQCVIADVKKLSRTSYQITANAEVQNATVTNYKFTTKNSSGSTVDTKSVDTNALSQSYTVEQTTPGTYEVKAVITTDKGVAAGDCSTTFTVEKEPTTPSWSCDYPKLVLNDRKATFSFVPTASNGASFKDATVKFEADGSVKETVTTDKVNSEGQVVTSYTYANDAENVRAVASVRFTIGSGKDAYTETVQCEGQDVLGTSTPPTTTLPDTGAGSVVMFMLAGIAAAGTYAHRALTLKRQ